MTLDVPRVLGRVDGAGPGPTLLGIGGLHGNEPAGVLALQALVRGLAPRAHLMTGRFVALAGNLAALRAGRRYLDSDLNRAWGRPLPEGPSSEATPLAGMEAMEKDQLLAAMDEVVATTSGPVFAIDLHTTSGPGGLFTTVADTLPNRTFAQHLPVPLILGLEELVDGTLLDYLGRRGAVAMVFESGQHQDARSVDRAVAGLWIAVAAAGLLPEHALPELAPARKLLARDVNGLPRVLEMRHRHHVSEDSGFRMRQGYRSFQRVHLGEVLARERAGDVLAPERARVLMPLYQEQGADGFFIVREFQPFWLHVSTLARRLRLARFVHWLPGIRRSGGAEGALEVDRRVARWYALQILHLVGYRKIREQGERLLVIPRPEERNGHRAQGSRGHVR